MKKFIMVLFASAVFTVGFAQTKNDRRDRDDNHTSIQVKNSNNSANSIKERDAKIASIKKDYTKQINAIKKNSRLKTAEKNRRISLLQKQRDQKIKVVMSDYSQNKNAGYNSGVANKNKRN